MYRRRIIILVIGCAVMLAVCVLRLADLQLLSTSFYREQVAQLRIQSGAMQQIRALRGKILDRKGEVLAADEPKFWLGVSYELSRFMDERDRQAMAIETDNADIQKKTTARLDDLEHLIDKCVQFGMPRDEAVLRLQKTNDRIWNLRMFLAWARNSPNQEIIRKYGGNLNNIPLAEALADFENRFTDPRKRLALIAKITDVAETRQVWPVVELKTDDDVFAARVEFLDVNGVQVFARGQRVYPFGPAACQTIGWVGQPGQADKDYFADDRLASYLGDEMCGREDGVEYVCEATLRGKRGEMIYDIDKQLIRQTEPQMGQDVRLTIDIALQQKIERYLGDCIANPKCKSAIGAVVLDARSGDILALVSMPNYDLNLIRQNYSELVNDPCEPLRNRALLKEYPPGSVIKPVILTAGLESGAITAGEVISCPSHAAPQGWPNCLIYLRSNIGHDTLWANYARNAIKGSCNVYFSHLADRIDPLILQNWLYKFGYGRKSSLDNNEPRDFRQYAGRISNNRPDVPVTSFEQLPALEPGERRWFGVGQGNLRVTPLQVANAMATLARGGIYKQPRLIDDPCSIEPEPIDLKISSATLATIYDGMHAVIEESGGTANREFATALRHFASMGVKIYGKTGSTEKPEHAWFGGFAKDSSGKMLAVAVVVEGGKQGSTDAAPLARDILLFCAEAGYIGR
ncbi:MAG: penicillin-binding transpeptidase domain-containing protein [Sedimentisphaerales bacterium]